MSFQLGLYIIASVYLLNFSCFNNQFSTGKLFIRCKATLLLQGQKGIVLVHELRDREGANRVWKHLLGINPLVMIGNIKSVIRL